MTHASKMHQSASLYIGKLGPACVCSYYQYLHSASAGSHYRALAFGRPQNDGTRSFYFETTSMSGEIFIALHLGSYQGVFYYKKTRPCLFCSCPATCEVAFFTSTFLRNYFLSQEMMCALSNCYQVQPR